MANTPRRPTPGRAATTPGRSDRTVRDEALRLLAPPYNFSLRQAADALGVSHTRIQQYRSPFNPNGDLMTYRCGACRFVWTGRTRNKPGRCKGCGSYYWRRGGSIARAPDPAAKP